MTMDRLVHCGEVFTSCERVTASPPPKRRKAKLIVNFFFLVLASSLTLFWVGLWKALDENDRLNLLKFIYNATGTWVDWTRVFFGISVATLVYLLLFLLLLICLVHVKRMQEEEESVSFRVHVAYGIFNGVIILFCLAAVGFISTLYYIGWTLLKLKIIHSAPIFHFVAIAVLTLAVGFLSQQATFFYFSRSPLLRARNDRRLGIFLGIFAVLLLISYILPFALNGNADWMPCVRDSIPPKPSLLAHKGAIDVAPENTQMSFKTAVNRGSFGFESDLQISRDGKLYMMHDESLKRTTNIENVFPDYADLRMREIASFKIDQLNAGEWYIKLDPMYSISSGRVSAKDLSEIRKQTIPTFREYLSIAKNFNQSVIWDMKYIPWWRSKEILQKTLDIIDEVGIRPELVWLRAKKPWFPSDPNSASYNKNDKKFKWTLFDQDEPEIDDIQYYLENNITNRNIGYARVFPTRRLLEFSSRNITNNVWVINSRWMFSLLWCTGGVDSVTTNIVEDLDRMSTPIGYMTPTEYRNLSIATIAVSIVVLFLWTAGTVLIPGSICH